MEKHMDRRLPCWERLAEECDELFDSLIHKYENKLDGKEKLKHFDVLCDFHILGQAEEELKEIKEKYSIELQRELIPWIKNEIQKNDLFKIENWKPYRQPQAIMNVFIGYRKLFKLKHLFFQLSLSYDCILDTCTYCEKTDNDGHFGLLLYGWKDINDEKLQPQNKIAVLDDNIIPESLWVFKY